MAKIKKYQKVEAFLNKLLGRDDFGIKELEALKYKDINQAEELEGIGDRTISNILNDFKVKKGIAPPEEKTTKSKKVETYLIKKIESGELTISELMGMRYADLKGVEELEGVGKTTITCALSTVKKQYDSTSFESGVLDFLAKEKTTTIPKPSPARSNQVAFQSGFSGSLTRNIQVHQAPFKAEEIGCIKEMIAQFNKEPGYELMELKNALQYAGINYQQLLQRYKEKRENLFAHPGMVSQNSPNDSMMMNRSS